MSWSKRGGYTGLAIAMAAAAAAVLISRRRTEVWHTLSDTDQN